MQLGISNCKNCQNTSCIIQNHASEQGIDRYLENKSNMRGKKGQSLIIEGAPIHGVYFVYQGRVKIFSTGINGREQIHRFAINGEMLGQRGFSSKQVYPVGAIALEDTLLCHFSIDTMRYMLQTTPKLAFAFMAYFAEELNRSETKVRMFAHMSVREKVIDALLYMNRKFGLKEGFLNIQLSRRDIADFAGTTEEQVIRVISSLKKDGILRSSGKKIGILNIGQLKNEISEHHYFIQS